MEGKFTSVWSEESEMIAHLQSMFWSNTDAVVNHASPNTSSDSCVTTSTMPSSNLPHHTEISGDKRAFPVDEQIDKRKNNKKHRTVAQVSRTLSSNSLDEKANTLLVNRNSSWCCSSEDDSNGVCFNESVPPKQSGSSHGHSRSSMNSQSIYAKKRRQRINEKLRILQQLIPNGTKVDISTMLEEAVQYVKFLQLQIKLLSSDETWMYAPLAYNGVAIDLGAIANKS